VEAAETHNVQPGRAARAEIRNGPGQFVRDMVLTDRDNPGILRSGEMIGKYIRD